MAVQLLFYREMLSWSPYHSTDTARTQKNFRFILSDKSNFHKVDNLSVAVHTLPMCILIRLSVDEILLPRYVNWSTNFRGLPFHEEMTSSRLK